MSKKRSNRNFLAYEVVIKEAFNALREKQKIYYEALKSYEGINAKVLQQNKIENDRINKCENYVLSTVKSSLIKDLGEALINCE